MTKQETNLQVLQNTLEQADDMPKVSNTARDVHWGVKQASRAQK